MKRRTLYMLGAVVVAAIAIGVLAGRPDPVSVETATASRGLVAETVTNTRAGTIKACQRARLAPPSGGQIAKLPVKKGDRVQAGQVLLELWNEDIRAELSLAERDAVASRARAEEACVSAAVAKKESERLAALVDRSLVAIDTADKAKGEADSRAAACRAATQNIKVSEARIQQAKASMERTLLRAPFAGIVAEINGELGEFVTPSPVGIPTPPAVDVVDTRCIYVTAPIDEVDAPRIREGMPARVSLDAFRDRTFPARVRRVAPYVLDVEKQARTVEIEAELQDIQSATLLPGYSADVEVILQERPDALRIPTRALIDGKRVFIYDAAEERVLAREVQTGLRNWEYVEITSGLQEGDRVVTTVDREGLADGARADVVRSASTP
ncbi:efflux RND transporter periplasmic adaptor subunit [Steroidobacter sp. S1-65]|uniref:Efflux RND transporter periplasmic adaptor subunit n=1 Tax=Steroidobacter gossypii TaxID=2805490 RepID=A0ABS1X6J1_9GAMM|nr:efflux RND transporter periplasmic adaptor subunit [Steroidobacter gossypii]MBM0108838.1 efflux RND transporter periplasmic adaptor subunit [Steroidobacter gossypii]